MTDTTSMAFQSSDAPYRDEAGRRAYAGREKTRSVARLIARALIVSELNEERARVRTGRPPFRSRVAGCENDLVEVGSRVNTMCAGGFLRCEGSGDCRGM